MLIEVLTRTGQLEPIIMAWVLTEHPAGFVESFLYLVSEVSTLGSQPGKISEVSIV